MWTHKTCFLPSSLSIWRKEVSWNPWLILSYCTLFNAHVSKFWVAPILSWLGFSGGAAPIANICIMQEGLLDPLAGWELERPPVLCLAGAPEDQGVAQPRKMEATDQEGSGCSSSPSSKAWKLRGGLWMSIYLRRWKRLENDVQRWRQQRIPLLRKNGALPKWTPFLFFLFFMHLGYKTWLVLTHKLSVCWPTCQSSIDTPRTVLYWSARHFFLQSSWHITINGHIHPNWVPLFFPFPCGWYIERTQSLVEAVRFKSCL